MCFDPKWLENKKEALETLVISSFDFRTTFMCVLKNIDEMMIGNATSVSYIWTPSLRFYERSEVIITDDM